MNALGGLPSSDSLRAYVRCWKDLVKLPPETPLRQGFSSSFPTTAGEERIRFQRALDNRINFRGGQAHRSDSPAAAERIRRNLKRTVACECRECGTGLVGYIYWSQRYCPDCRGMR